MILDILNIADPVLNISKSVDNIEHFIKIDDTLIDYIYYSDNKQLDEAKKIINKIKKRELYSFVCEKNFSKLDIKKKICINDFLEKTTELQKDDVIIHNLCLGYTGYSYNPVDNISFYDLNNPQKLFKYEKDHVSKLIPDSFNENIIRIFSRKKEKNNIIKTIFEQLIKIYNY
tara:strand:- start:188 stop:706 length:519 start_codon:yes stop_codon:yes gene_type:complete